MTVGELVERETAGGRTISEVGRGVMNYAGVQGVLVRLGIWDAEVLEGALTIPHSDAIVPGEPCGLPIAIENPGWTYKRIGRLGQRVRVIVLPCPEKENECTGKVDECRT